MSIMKKYNYKKIDAFATQNSEGNPAGYVWLDNEQQITEQEMLQIAREQKGFVTETGFVRKKSNELLELKYYSSEREVDFCGHATIAILYDVLKNKPEFTARETLSIQTNRGVLTVYNRIEQENAVFIMSPVPEYRSDVPDMASISRNLGIAVEDIAVNWPVKIINAGLTTLIVPIAALKTILAIHPNFTQLKSFCTDNHIDIIEVFCPEVSSPDSDYRTRVFAPTFGYLEDMATGSGNSAFGYYLLQLKRWTKETLTIEQNGEPDKFNVVKLQRTSDANSGERVLFGGGAITRIEGHYFIY